MPCGISIHAATDLPRSAETPTRRTWLCHALNVFRAMIDRERRRQLSFELEKARQQGLLEGHDRMLADLGTRDRGVKKPPKPF
jgi:hypothetical protein